MPFADESFDLTLASLVVHFMTDPVAGIREMARVTRTEGVVGACVWDYAAGGGPLTEFWQAVRSLDPAVSGESELAGTREGHLAELFAEAGLRDVEPAVLRVTARFQDFPDWWEPFTLGVGPAGTYVRGLDERGRAELRDRCASLLPEEGPVELSAAAWVAIGRPALE
nr:methyltransferase domain-containing protein [Actinoplanes lutulentus]